MEADINPFLQRYLTEYIPVQFKQYTDPLFLSWYIKPLHQSVLSVFTALVYNLLNREDSPKFQVRNPLTFTTHNYTAVILLTDFGDILLLDGIYWITICSNDPFKRCYALREAGIHEVVSHFKDMAEFKYFNCKICCNEFSEHFCHLSDDQKTVICCNNHTAACFNKCYQFSWFSVEGEFCSSVTYSMII